MSEIQFDYEKNHKLLKNYLYKGQSLRSLTSVVLKDYSLIKVYS